jgi:hypothetical protein
MKPDMAAAIATLTDVLERENAALAALDMTRTGALLGEKRVACDALAQAHRDDREAMPPNAAMPRLRDLAEENRRLLERAMAVQGRVIEVIARAAPRAAAVPGYGATGGRAGSGRPIPLAFSARA